MKLRRWMMPVVVVLLLGACRTDWATWGGGPERQGFNAAETTIGPANAGALHHLWSADLGGYVDSAPVVAAGLTVGATLTDVIYVGTERGTFAAVRENGQVLWTRNLGSHVANCPDTPGGVYGVQASAVLDRASNRVFVVGGDGKAYALDPLTGATRAGWPVVVTDDPVHNAVYSAPTLFNGLLYVETASHCDQTPYRGRIVRIDTATRATTVWWVAGSPTGPLGAGIWGWGGASVDPRDVNLYVATGNLFANPENTPFGDSVVRLSPSLQIVTWNSPAPLIGDDDFGSTPTLFQKPGCPPQLATEQKNGSLFLYDRDAIASGPRQRVVFATDRNSQGQTVPASELIGVPAYSPATEMLYVANPIGTVDGQYVHGMVAFRISASCRLVRAWQTTAGLPGWVTSTPTIANGVVYYGDGAGNHLHAFDAATGRALWSSGAEMNAPVFTAPAVVNGRVYAGAYDNRLHAWGP